MRIGISTLMIQRGETGIAQYLFALLRALLPSCADHQFTLFVLEKDLPLFAFAEGAMKLVRVPERYRPPVWNILWHQAHLPRLARKYKLHVVHVPSYRRLPARKSCATVATIHDLAPFRIPGKYDWKRMFYARVIVRRLARRQNAVIAVSQTTARDIASFCRLARNRIAVVHNGLEHERFFPGSRQQAKAEVAERYRMHHPFFLYVARLEHPGKNHERLIAAFNEFKAVMRSDWQLAFGGSDWHGAQTIRAAARQSPYASDIRFLGFVPNETLPGLYRAADVFVYPSLYEGFGMPPLEAMACGCPVISSARGALREVIGNAAAIVDPENTGLMAAQLAALSESAELRESFRIAGLAQARRFDWRKTAAATLEVYGRAALRGSAAAGANREYAASV